MFKFFTVETALILVPIIFLSIVVAVIWRRSWLLAQTLKAIQEVEPISAWIWPVSDRIIGATHIVGYAIRYNGQVWTSTGFALVPLLDGKLFNTAELAIKFATEKLGFQHTQLKR